MHRLLLLDITFFSMHPSDDLFQGKHVPAPRPVCDHYAGSEKRMREPLTPDLPMPAWIETHAAMHKTRSTSAPGKVACQPLGVMASARAHRSAIHDTAIKNPDALRHAHVMHAKLKIAAACHASGWIASHNGCPDIYDRSAVVFDAIKTAESKLNQHTSTLHDCASYPNDGVVIQRAKRSGQSLPEAAGALM